jgi:hypothetical protein
VAEVEGWWDWFLAGAENALRSRKKNDEPPNISRLYIRIDDVNLEKLERSIFLMRRSRTMRRRYDHIDLRVRSLAEARPFYETLLPALGFARDVRIEHSLQFEADGVDGATEFFGVTESSRHVANECRIAFWAESPSEVNRVCAEQKRGQQ